MYNRVYQVYQVYQVILCVIECTRKIRKTNYNPSRISLAGGGFKGFQKDFELYNNRSCIDTILIKRGMTAVSWTIGSRLRWGGRQACSVTMRRWLTCAPPSTRTPRWVRSSPPQIMSLWKRLRGASQWRGWRLSKFAKKFHIGSVVR